MDYQKKSTFILYTLFPLSVSVVSRLGHSWRRESDWDVTHLKREYKGQGVRTESEATVKHEPLLIHFCKHWRANTQSSRPIQQSYHTDVLILSLSPCYSFKYTMVQTYISSFSLLSMFFYRSSLHSLSRIIFYLNFSLPLPLSPPPLP